MAENKTQPTDADVAAFLAALEPAQRRADAQAICALLAEVSGTAPVLWGSIVGFGSYDYTYASGRSGTAPRLGFAPRKAQHVIYLMDGFDGHADLLARLGKATTGVAICFARRNGLVSFDSHIVA